MGMRSFIKRTAKDNTNVKAWASWGLIKENAKTIGTFMDSLNPEDQAKEPAKETFEEAMKKYNLSENDVILRAKKHFRVALLCVIFGVAAFLWMFVLFFKGMFLSGIVALAVSLLMCSYAFREHFYYFQMKQRRLNCTFKEWFSNLFHFAGKNI